MIDGDTLTGWFTEDFTWAELSTLRASERLPEVRPNSASFDGVQPVLRLRDLLDIIDAASIAQGRQLVDGRRDQARHLLRVDRAAARRAVRRRDRAAGRRPRTSSSRAFEQTVLCRSASAGCRGGSCSSLEAPGSPADLVARLGRRASRTRRTSPTPGSPALRATASTASASTRRCCCEWMRGRTSSAPPTWSTAPTPPGSTSSRGPCGPRTASSPSNLRRGRSPRDYGDWLDRVRPRAGHRRRRGVRRPAGSRREL